VVTIVALTAHNPSLFFEDFSDAGFDELLTKPYSLDKIVELINNLV
jgi:CheY-like chemotaxis protein